MHYVPRRTEEIQRTSVLALGERQWTGVDIPVSPWLGARMSGFFLMESESLPVTLNPSWGHWMGCLSGHTSGQRRVVNWWSHAVSWWGRMLDRHGTLSEGAIGTSGRGLGYRCSNLTSGRAVDHNILLPRLEHTICIKCIVLLWFESCRIDLHLFVWMFSSHS